jgi:hypothetical protein
MKKIRSFFAIASAFLSIQQAAQSAIILDSVNWTTAGIPASGVFGTNNITLNTASYLNAGQLFTFDWGSMPFASNYDTTSDSAVAIGYTTGISTTTVTFSQSISDLSLWFNYIDEDTTFNFTGLNWTFVAGNNASRVGDTVVSTGLNNSDDGFLINLTGAFGASTPLSFTITKSGSPNTAGFTLAAPAPTNPVPEPGQVAASMLLLIGIGGYVFLKRRKLTKSAESAAA